MQLRTRFAVSMGTFAICLAASASAEPAHGGPPTEKGKPGSSAHDEKEKNERDNERHAKHAHADGKKEADKEKAEKDDGEKGKPGGPPGLAAKDDERHKKLLVRWEERRKTLKERAQAARDELRRKLGVALENQLVRQELRRHAMAVARLERIKEIADTNEKPDLSSRATAALAKENARHDKRIAALSHGSSTASVSGGAP